MFKSDIASLK